MSSYLTDMVKENMMSPEKKEQMEIDKLSGKSTEIDTNILAKISPHLDPFNDDSLLVSFFAIATNKLILTAYRHSTNSYALQVGANRQVTDPIFMVVGLVYVCILIFGSALAPALM